MHELPNGDIVFAARSLELLRLLPHPLCEIAFSGTRESTRRVPPTLILKVFPTTRRNRDMLFPPQSLAKLSCHPRLDGQVSKGKSGVGGWLSFTRPAGRPDSDTSLKFRQELKCEENLLVFERHDTSNSCVSLLLLNLPTHNGHFFPCCLLFLFRPPLPPTNMTSTFSPSSTTVNNICRKSDPSLVPQDLVFLLVSLP